jgi:hypothetical protein
MRYDVLNERGWVWGTRHRNVRGGDSFELDFDSSCRSIRRVLQQLSKYGPREICQAKYSKQDREEKNGD